MSLSRAVTPQQDADRRAAYAVADCDACAATICGMKPPAYYQWRRKAGLAQKGPCAKNAKVRRAPAADPAPSPSIVLEREPYIQWLQQAITKERSESNRLRRSLMAARGSLDKAIQRPPENDAGEAPAARLGSKPRVALPHTGNSESVAVEDAEPDDDFDAASPLRSNEVTFLRILRASQDGRASTTRLFDVMPKRSCHWAGLRLKRRGFVTVRPGIGEGESPFSSIYALTDAGRAAQLPEPLTA